MSKEDLIRQIADAEKKLKGWQDAREVAQARIDLADKHIAKLNPKLAELQEKLHGCQEEEKDEG